MRLKGICGHQLTRKQNIQTYAPWELVMEKLPDGAENIATLKVKWDPAYQEKVGVATRAADLTPEQQKTLERLSKRIALSLERAVVEKSEELKRLDAKRLPAIQAATDARDQASAAAHRDRRQKQTLQRVSEQAWLTDGLLRF